MFFFYISIQFSFSDEILFRVLEDTPAWIFRNFRDPLTDANADRIIPKDSLVSNPTRASVIEINGMPSIHDTVFFNNTKYIISANAFTAKDTEEIFNESFLSNSDPQKMTWINSYLLTALQAGDRDMLKPYEQIIVDRFKYDELIRWYDFGSGFDRSFITQSTISIGGFSQDSFLIRRIEHISDGYCVTVIWSTNYFLEGRSMTVNLPSKNETPIFNFYFIIDGDYLDIFYSTDFTGSDKIYCSTFVRIDYEIRNQLFRIISYNINSSFPVPYYPERLTFWPRRADGSMDYPPPLNMSSYRPTHRTTENLRLRDSANTSSLIVTTLLKDTEVQVIETGANATINNITAPWVKVISSTGFTGWCFSGYLEEIAVNNSAADAFADKADNSLVSNEDAKALPFWVWIVISAGVVVGVGVVVIVRKRK